MKRLNEKYVNRLVDKFLNENLQDKADELMEKIQSNLDEKLGGMDDDHPKFGKLNLSKMSPEEIDAMMSDYISSDDEDEDYDDEFDKESQEIERIEKDLHPEKYGSMRSRFFDKEDEESEWDDEELEEGFDDPYVKKARGGEDYSPKEFRRIPKGGNLDLRRSDRDDSITHGKYLKNKLGDLRDILGKMHDDDDDGDDLVTEGDVCECGGSLYEGECMECGKSYMDEGIYDESEPWGEDPQSFDYVEEGMFDEEGDEEFDYSEPDANEERCEFHMKHFGRNDERTAKFCKGIMTEKLSRKQKRYLDQNDNDEIDSEDFRMLHKKRKQETKEGAKPDFLDLDKDGNKKESMKSASKSLKKKKIEETIYKVEIGGKIHTLTENELISVIEEATKEEMNLKPMGTAKPKGLTKYEEVHRKDGKENADALKATSEKMKEYLKDGSKGEYDENPKHFPKGNGQLAKMAAKKYTMSDDGKDFLDNFMRPGMEDLVPEEIEYDEDWVEDNIKGSSRTANNPEWANAEETELGEKLVKKLKAKKFHKAKELAYRKSKQPVTDGTGENSGSGVNLKLESLDEKEKTKLNEEFERMKGLIGYDRKTQ
jgi:hypothetical protein